jgi:hypothetical protein
LGLQRAAWDRRVEGEGRFVRRILGKWDNYVKAFYRIRGRPVRVNAMRVMVDGLINRWPKQASERRLLY